MADTFLGLRMRVVLNNPEVTIEGTVSRVIPDQVLTLKDALVIEANQQLVLINLKPEDIKSISQLPVQTTPKAMTPVHTDSPTSFTLNASSAAHTPVPRPPPSVSPTKVTFQDPAILSLGKRPVPASPAASASGRHDEGKKLANHGEMRDPLPTSVSPSKMDRLSLTGTSRSTKEDEGRKLTQAPSSKLTDTTEDELADEPVVAHVPPSASKSSKRTRRRQKNRGQHEGEGEGNMVTPTSTRHTDPQGDGWRQTPILHSNKSFQPYASLKRGQKGRHSIPGENDWASEDVTDVQEAGDFDFEGSLAKFDKRSIFNEMREQDRVSEAERLVSYNRMSRPKPGTAGGKNLHYTENVLDMGSSKAIPSSSSAKQLAVETPDDFWKSEADVATVNGNGDRLSGREGSGRSSRLRGESRVSTTRRSQSRKASAAAAAVAAAASSGMGGPTGSRINLGNNNNSNNNVRRYDYVDGDDDDDDEEEGDDDQDDDHDNDNDRHYAEQQNESHPPSRSSHSSRSRNRRSRRRPGDRDRDRDRDKDKDRDRPGLVIMQDRDNKPGSVLPFKVTAIAKHRLSVSLSPHSNPLHLQQQQQQQQLQHHHHHHHHQSATPSSTAPPTAGDGFYSITSNRRIETITHLQMLNLENIAHNEVGLTEDLMAENAGRSIAEVALIALDDPAIKLRNASASATANSNTSNIIVVLAGNHKSGARAIAAARHLLNRGINTLVCVVGIERERELAADLQRQIRVYRNFGGAVFTRTQLFEQLASGSAGGKGNAVAAPPPPPGSVETPVTLIIDALLGLSMSFEELRKSDQGTTYVLMDWANRNAAFCVAVDVPSGVDPTTGKVNVIDGASLYVHPRYVVALGAPKQGLLKAIETAYEGDAAVGGEAAGTANAGGGGICGDGCEWKLHLGDVGLGAAVWRKAATNAKLRRGIEFDERWTMEMRYQPRFVD